MFEKEYSNVFDSAEGRLVVDNDLISNQAIDMFMSSCTFFVFLSLIEYAFVNVMMGDIR